MPSGYKVATRFGAYVPLLATEKSWPFALVPVLPSTQFESLLGSHKYLSCPALMLALGCDSALNLDGGGSTEMVRADIPGRPYILNNPSGGAERFDAAALGVYARPLRDDRTEDGDPAP